MSWKIHDAVHDRKTGQLFHSQKEQVLFGLRKLKICSPSHRRQLCATGKSKTLGETLELKMRYEKIVPRKMTVTEF